LANKWMSFSSSNSALLLPNSEESNIDQKLPTKSSRNVSTWKKGGCQKTRKNTNILYWLSLMPLMFFCPWSQDSFKDILEPSRSLCNVCQERCGFGKSFLYCRCAKCKFDPWLKPDFTLHLNLYKKLDIRLLKCFVLTVF
jgi:hypothetical protein